MPTVVNRHQAQVRVQGGSRSFTGPKADEVQDKPLSWAVVTPPDAHLDELIAEAIVDAYDEHEQLSGFHVMIEENLALPFETTMLGMPVTVKKIELRLGTGIAAICHHGRHRQAIGILDLPLPEPRPDGAEWIDAYQRWAG
jgi:hypothetical protein